MNSLKTRYLIRKRAMGDVLWIEPLIRQLSNDNTKLVVCTKFNALFANYPLTNVEFISSLPLFHKINLRIHRIFKWKFRYIDLDNAYESNPMMHILHAYQHKAGLPQTVEYPQIFCTNETVEAVQGMGRYVILHIETMSAHNYRNIYGINWQEVVTFITNMGFAVIQIGINPEPVKGAVYLKTSIPEMIRLINGSDFFIGIDSGPSHIATAFGKKNILFFGAVNPWLRHFRSLFNGIIMQSYCEFANCYHTNNNGKETVCRLVGNEGMPKCSIHQTQDILNNIIKLTSSDKQNL